MKVAALIGFSFAIVFGSPATAEVIFADSFSKLPRGSHQVGGAPRQFPSDVWSEGALPKDVSVIGGTLQLLDEQRTPKPQAQAGQLHLSTLGYENIVLSFDWIPNRAFDRGDHLLVLFPDINETDTFSMRLIGRRFVRTVTHETIRLSPDADDLTNFEFIFRLAVNSPGEGVRIDMFA